MERVWTIPSLRLARSFSRWMLTGLTQSVEDEAYQPTLSARRLSGLDRGGGQAVDCAALLDSEACLRAEVFQSEHSC